MTPQTRHMTARDVSETLLVHTANALMARDFDSFSQVFHLPQVMTTSQSRITVTHRHDLQRVFEGMCDHFESVGVTNLIRECNVAEFRSPERVEATHISHVIADSRHVVPPYPVFSVIEWIDGCWKIVSADYALEESSGQAAALRTAGDVKGSAEAIYQDHLDLLSAALINGDFATFKSRISLPHQITTETDIITMTTETQMKDAFDSFAQIYGNEGVTDFVRIVKEAQFVSDTEIVGVHISHKMRGGKRLMAPYPNRVRLVRGSDGIWRETHCANAILNDSNNFRLWTRLAETPRLPDLPHDPERTPT